MSLAARCIAAIATGVVAADLPGKARAHVERRATAKRRPVTDRHPAVKAAKERKATNDAAWDEFSAWVRATVFALSGGCCEHCHRPMGDGLGDWDHARGGAHRRESTRVERSRRLCRKCHDQRTDEKPSADYWRTHMDETVAARWRRAAGAALQADVAQGLHIKRLTTMGVRIA